MSGPAHNGVIIYSSRIDELAAFYTALFNMQLTRKTPDFISLDKDGFNLIVHVPPVELKENTFNSVKVFLSVNSLEETRAQTVLLGGQVFKGEWSNPIFTVSNIADIDGNHIQIREFKA